MGRSIHNTVGYGLMIPYTEEECGYDEEKLPKEWVALLDEHNGDTWYIFSHLLKGYPELTWESSYLDDYSGVTVIFVKAFQASEYGMSPVRLPDKIMYSPETYEYDKQLVKVAYKIGMPIDEVGANLGVWSVVSYG